MFDEIIQVITNVGFPIACCVFLFMEVKSLSKTLSELNTTLTVINTRLDNIEDMIKKEAKNVKQQLD